MLPPSAEAHGAPCPADGDNAFTPPGGVLAIKEGAELNVPDLMAAPMSRPGVDNERTKGKSPGPSDSTP